MSCGGTSIVTVLRLTRTIFWTTGRIMMSPGPLTPRSTSTRPSVNSTPLSYSLSILMELMRIKTMTATAIAKPEMPGITFMSASVSGFPCHLQFKALDLLHGYFLAFPDRLVRIRAPVRALHEHVALRRDVRPRLADLADHGLAAGSRPYPARA